MKTALVVLAGEIRKGLLNQWTYGMNAVIGLLTLGFIFFIVVFFVGGGQLEPDALASSLIGYLAWMYVALTISDLSYGLGSEISAGTLEQMAMSPMPLALILIGRVLTTLIVTTIQVIVMAGTWLLLLGVRLPINGKGILVLVVMLVGVLGFGFLIAGVTLIFKQIAALANLMNNALAFLNGAFLPISALPAWLSTISRTLPSTQGIIVLRRVTLEGQSLMQVWQDHSLIWLIFHSLIYFTIGWLAFAYCESTAKKQGTLGQY